MKLSKSFRYLLSALFILNVSVVSAQTLAERVDAMHERGELVENVLNGSVTLVELRALDNHRNTVWRGLSQRLKVLLQGERSGNEEYGELRVLEKIEKSQRVYAKEVVRGVFSGLSVEQENEVRRILARSESRSKFLELVKSGQVGRARELVSKVLSRVEASLENRDSVNDLERAYERPIRERVIDVVVSYMDPEGEGEKILEGLSAQERILIGKGLGTYRKMGFYLEKVLGREKGVRAWVLTELRNIGDREILEATQELRTWDEFEAGDKQERIRAKAFEAARAAMRDYNTQEIFGIENVEGVLRTLSGRGQAMDEVIELLRLGHTGYARDRLIRGLGEFSREPGVINWINEIKEVSARERTPAEGLRSLNGLTERTGIMNYLVGKNLAKAAAALEAEGKSAEEVLNEIQVWMQGVNDPEAKKLGMILRTYLERRNVAVKIKGQELAVRASPTAVETGPEVNARDRIATVNVLRQRASVEAASRSLLAKADEKIENLNELLTRELESQGNLNEMYRLLRRGDEEGVIGRLMRHVENPRRLLAWRNERIDTHTAQRAREANETILRFRNTNEGYRNFWNEVFGNEIEPLRAEAMVRMALSRSWPETLLNYFEVKNRVRFTRKLELELLDVGEYQPELRILAQRREAQTVNITTTVREGLRGKESIVTTVIQGIERATVESITDLMVKLGDYEEFERWVREVEALEGGAREVKQRELSAWVQERWQEGGYRAKSEREIVELRQVMRLATTRSPIVKKNYEWLTGGLTLSEENELLIRSDEIFGSLEGFIERMNRGGDELWEVKDRLMKSFAQGRLSRNMYLWLQTRTYEEGKRQKKELLKIIKENAEVSQRWSEMMSPLTDGQREEVLTLISKNEGLMQDLEESLRRGTNDSREKVKNRIVGQLSRSKRQGKEYATLLRGNVGPRPGPTANPEPEAPRPTGPAPTAPANPTNETRITSEQFVEEQWQRWQEWAEKPENHDKAKILQGELSNEEFETALKKYFKPLENKNSRIDSKRQVLDQFFENLNGDQKVFSKAQFSLNKSKSVKLSTAASSDFVEEQWQRWQEWAKNNQDKVKELQGDLSSEDFEVALKKYFKPAENMQSTINAKRQVLNDFFENLKGDQKAFLKAMVSFNGSKKVSLDSASFKAFVEEQWQRWLTWAQKKENDEKLEVLQGDLSSEDFEVALKKYFKPTQNKKHKLDAKRQVLNDFFENLKGDQKAFSKAKYSFSKSKSIELDPKATENFVEKQWQRWQEWAGELNNKEKVKELQGGLNDQAFEAALKKYFKPLKNNQSEFINKTKTLSVFYRNLSSERSSKLFSMAKRAFNHSNLVESDPEAANNFAEAQWQRWQGWAGEPKNEGKVKELRGDLSDRAFEIALKQYFKPSSNGQTSINIKRQRVNQFFKNIRAKTNDQRFSMAKRAFNKSRSVELDPKAPEEFSEAQWKRWQEWAGESENEGKVKELQGDLSKEEFEVALIQYFRPNRNYQTAIEIKSNGLDQFFNNLKSVNRLDFYKAKHSFGKSRSVPLDLKASEDFVEQQWKRWQRWEKVNRETAKQLQGGLTDQEFESALKKYFKPTLNMQSYFNKKLKGLDRFYENLDSGEVGLNKAIFSLNVSGRDKNSNTKTDNYNSGIASVEAFEQLDAYLWSLLSEELKEAVERMPERLRGWIREQFVKKVKETLGKVQRGETGVQSALRATILRIVKPGGQQVARELLQPVDRDELLELAKASVTEPIENAMGQGPEDPEREKAFREFREEFRKALSKAMSLKRIGEQQVEFLLAVWIMDVVKEVVHGESLDVAMKRSMEHVLSQGHLEGLAGFVAASSVVSGMGVLALRNAVNSERMAVLMSQPLMQKAMEKLIGATSMFAGVSAMNLIGKTYSLGAIKDMAVRRYGWMRSYAYLEGKRGAGELVGQVPASLGALYALSREGGNAALWESEPTQMRKLMGGFNPNYAYKRQTVDGTYNYLFHQKLKLQVMNKPDQRQAALQRYDLREAITSTAVVMVSSIASKFFTRGTPVVSTMLTLVLSGMIEKEILVAKERIKTEEKFKNWIEKMKVKRRNFTEGTEALRIPLILTESYIAKEVEPLTEESEIVWMEMADELSVRGYMADHALRSFVHFVQEAVSQKIQDQIHTTGNQLSEIEYAEIESAMKVSGSHVAYIRDRWVRGEPLCQGETAYATHTYLERIDQYAEKLMELECQVAAFDRQWSDIHELVKGLRSLTQKLERALIYDENRKIKVGQEDGTRTRYPLQLVIQDNYIRLVQSRNQYTGMQKILMEGMEEYSRCVMCFVIGRSQAPNALPGQTTTNKHLTVETVGNHTEITVGVPGEVMGDRSRYMAVLYDIQGNVVDWKYQSNQTVYDDIAKAYEMKFTFKLLPPNALYDLKIYSKGISETNRKPTYKWQMQVRVPHEAEGL